MADYQATFSEHARSRGFLYSSSQALASKSETLMFNISGGVPLEKKIAGLETVPAGESMQASSQLCLRTDGWNKIGETGRHHLAFTMLGHFMLDEADEVTTKDRMISFAVDYLDVLDLMRENIHGAVHPNDSVSHMALQKSGVKNIELDDKLTSVEALGQRSGFRVELSTVRMDGRMTEVWNIVFHQNDAKTGRALGLISADSGTSLERVAATIEKVPSNYASTVWRDKVAAVAGYFENSPSSSVYRIADCMNASLHLLGQGFVPVANKAGYVSRKIAREVLSLGLAERRGFDEIFAALSRLADHDEYKRYNHGAIFTAIEGERDKLVSCCIAPGIRKYIKGKSELNATEITYLRDTHGLPERLAPMIAAGSLKL